jgi:hypothetical protein
MGDAGERQGARQQHCRSRDQLHTTIIAITYVPHAPAARAIWREPLRVIDWPPPLIVTETPRLNDATPLEKLQPSSGLCGVPLPVTTVLFAGFVKRQLN